jgi:hypothetical protein
MSTSPGVTRTHGRSLLDCSEGSLLCGQSPEWYGANSDTLYTCEGQLQKSEMRETLIECKRRPKGKPCPGLMWVVKTDDDGILAQCVLCKTRETFIHNWQKTEWADGMMEPVPVDLGGPEVH